MHKHWALGLMLSYAVILLVLSLITVGKIPTIGSSFDDKLNHFGAYALLTLFIHNYLIKNNLKNVLWYSLLAAVSYGVLIELLQKFFTKTRMFDGYDMLANFFGAVFAVLLIILYKKLKLK